MHKRGKGGGEMVKTNVWALCDRCIVAWVKGKVYKMVVRTAMMYGLDMVALTKRQKV